MVKVHSGLPLIRKQFILQSLDAWVRAIQNARFLIEYYFGYGDHDETVWAIH